MFNEEELVFIEDMLEQELFTNNLKRNKIENYSDVKKFDEMIEPRNEFIRGLLNKIQGSDEDEVKRV